MRHRANLPLHVTPLRTTQSKDAVLREHVQAHRINTLLVDDHKVLPLLLAVDGLIADEVLELDDLADFVVDSSTLRLDELLPLLGRGVEETRVDLAGPSEKLVTKVSW